MAENHSAEFCRGAVHVAKDCEEPVAVAYYTQLLAAAEAREGGEQTIKPDWSDAMAHATSGRVSPGTVTVNAGTPTAAEVIEAAEKCLHHERQGLQNLIDFRAFWWGGERRYGALTMEELTDAMKRMEAVNSVIARYKEANGGK